MAQKIQLATQAFNEVIKGVVKLHLVGGISLVLSGCAGVVLILAPIFSMFIPEVDGKPANIPSELYYATLVVGIAGALIGGLERYIEYRLTARRLDMMATITEDLIRGAIPNNDKLNPDDVGKIVEKTFEAISKNSALTYNQTGNQTSEPYGNTVTERSQTES
jgi:hypothetical protein